MLRSVIAKSPLHLLLLAVVVLWSIPTVALLVSSFREGSAIATSGWWQALTHPGQLTLENYDAVLGNRGMGRAFLNSLIITIPATALVVLVAAFAAYAFAFMDFPARDQLFLLLVALLVVPLQMTLIPLLRLYGHLTIDAGLPLVHGNVFGVNSFTGLWLAHAAYGLPFAIFLLRNFFVALPRDLLESAYIDGASDFTVFRRLVLPLAAPSLAALAIFQFLWVWNDLLVSLVFLGDASLYPMTVQVQSLVSSFGTNYQVLTAAAFVSMALPLALFFTLQRYFVEGILAGAVKG